MKIKTTKTVAELLNKIHSTESRILSITTNIETELEVIVADYFSKGDFEDYKLFSHLFYGNEAKLTFSQKIKIFEKFLKKVYPSYLKTNKDFINSLERVRKIRNKFAHHINPRQSELNDYVGKDNFPLHYVEDGLPKSEIFSWKVIMERFKDFENILNETKKIMNYCQTIYRLKSKSKKL